MNTRQQKFRLLAIAAILTVLLQPSSVLACAVCYGAPGDPVNTAMAGAILFMLALVLCVLGTFVGFFIYLAKMANHPPSHLEEIAQIATAELDR